MALLPVSKWPPGQPITHETVRAAWGTTEFTCELWMDPPGQEWLDFVHAADEKILLQEGSIEVEVEGARAVLEPGDEVLVPAGARHSLWNRGSGNAKWFYGYRR